jgi:Ca-activated chloride channel family protein
VDVVLALDVSTSMLAEDIKPSRLEKARSAAGRLLDLLGGDRVGVVGFAGSAATLCPLTLDHAAARIFLDALGTDLLTEPGTSLATALHQVAATFKSADRRFKAAVIFSDGEDQTEELEEAVEAAAEQGIVVHTVGVGTPAGGPIPIRDATGGVLGYKEDREGLVVTTRLDEEALARIAEGSGGKYLPATLGEGEIDTIAEAIGGMDKREMEQRLLTQYEERFQVPLALGIALLVLEAAVPDRRRAAPRRSVRRRAAAALLAAAAGLAAAAAPARAATAAALVEEGNRLFEAGRHDDALKLYTQAQLQAPDAPEIHLDIGNVFYRKGEMEKAREAYARAFSAADRKLAGAARYNSGTADLSAGDLKGAVRAFREALKMDPDDADARRNLEVALRMMQQAPQPPPQARAGEGEGGGEKEPSERPQAGDPNAPPRNEEAGQAGQGEGKDQEAPRRAEKAAGSKDRQEAERILDALRSEDRPRLDAKRQRPPERRPALDW